MCRECGFKFYLNVAAAAIALIFNADQQILVTRRKHDPARDMLDFPGGFAEPGESVEACLVREIKEELNLDISNLTYFGSFPSHYLFKKIDYPIMDMAFLCTVNDFSTITPQDDVSDFYFLDIAQIDAALFGLNSPKLIIRQLQNSHF